MRREEGGGINIVGSHSLSSISQGAIMGAIAALDVPQVKAGAYIDIDIEYYAYNPNGSFWNPWKLFLVAKDNAGNMEMVKDVDVRDDEFPAGMLDGARQKDSLRLWQMPNQAINLEIRLYGHDEIVSWNWDWW